MSKTEIALCRRRLCLSAVLCAVVQTAAAGELTPMTPPHGNPFLQTFGLPAAEPVTLPRPGDWRLSLGYAQTNNADRASDGGEFVVLDGENYRLNLSARYGVTDAFSLGLDLPLVHRDGGFLDNPIREWHSLLGVSNSNRAGTANRLNFVYGRDGVPPFEASGSRTGLGDVQLSAHRRLAGARFGGSPLVLSVTLKLPTGDADALRGSGAADLGLAAQWSRTAANRFAPDVYARAGVLALGESDVFGSATNDWVGFLTTALRWRVTQRLSALAQFDLQSAYVDSVLDEIGGTTMQLTVGGRLDFVTGGSLDVAVVEDLFGDATPDVTLHVAWSRRF